MELPFEDLKPLFEKDDGYFPEIYLAKIPREKVVKIYDLIRAKTRFLVGSPTFFHRVEQKDKGIDSVPNAALEVVSRKAEPFHFLVQGVIFLETRIPDLGIFIFDNGVAIDYQKGKAWGEKEILAFFEFLRQVVDLAGDAEIAMDSMIPEDLRTRFFLALGEYCETTVVP